jgi:site-specific recombinase XerC
MWRRLWRRSSSCTPDPRLSCGWPALRMLFDWMVVGQVIPVNPAHAVRGPKHSQRRGKTPVLQVEEARTLIYAIDTTSLPGQRDRALIGLMVYGGLNGSTQHSAQTHIH